MESADTIVGYGTYLDLVRPLIEGKTIVNTGMTKEVQRVAAGIDAALQGACVAVISSGDPGIYAMAGLVLEMCAKRDLQVAPAPADPPEGGIAVEIVPGIPALCAGAALLGAPLMHDFAAVSLSDLLTPWERIEIRLEAAASADFVIVVYNPKSKKRHWQLARACELVQKHRRPDTPVGIVTGAMRPHQRVQMTTLEKLPQAEVDMQTTVFIGNSNTRFWGEWMLTPRGYEDKYDIG